MSYPVTEFRGTAVNIDGDGRVESGSRELGAQRSGTTGDAQFFALSLSEVSEFRLVYPRGQSLRTVDPRHVTTWLVRASARPLSESATAQGEIELTGPIDIKFKENTDFAIRVNLKGTGTNEVALRGEFLAYSVQDFEPMTYLASIPMLFGFGEASFGPARVKTREGNMNLVREAVAKLSKKRNSGASVDIRIVEANRWITFTKNTALVNPTGIRLSFPVDSTREFDLKARMESVCGDMGLNLNLAASRELTNPTVEMEPSFLSVDLHGKTAEVSETIEEILRQVFGVTEKSRFQITE